MIKKYFIFVKKNSNHIGLFTTSTLKENCESHKRVVFYNFDSY